MSDLVGRNFGPYRILEQVGAGGMATVYKAYHPAMDRYVAIKVLPQHLARDASFRARFEREARTIARLEHRYILPVHDVGEEDGIPYLVMRYTDSGDLNKLIASKSLSMARLAGLVGHVAEALAYAHQQGIIHRDIKPANILVSRDGDPLLTDFGIAKIYADTAQLTSEGMLVGTPSYMAPEQLQGHPVDARADIYALGVVLYQTLTGEPPFVAETPLAVALMHVHNPLRPPRQINPNIPEPIERVILRAMAKNPDDRFQTAADMAEALRQSLLRIDQSTLMLAPSSAEHMAPTAAVEPEVVTLAAPGMPAEPAAAAPPATQPVPAASAKPAPNRAARWLALGGTLLVIALIALLAIPRLLPSAGSGAAPSAPGAPAGQSSAPGPTVVPRANLQVLGSTAETVGLAALGDVVWAATRGGLVRYTPDGQRRTFTTADGLPFNRAYTLVAAPDGALWVTGDRGIARIRPVADGLGEVRLYNNDDGLDIGEPRALMVDSDGSLWAGGAAYAAYHISHLEGGRWKGLEMPADDPALQDLAIEVLALLRGRDGALWVGLERGGVLRYDGQRWARVGAEQSISEVAIRRIFEDQTGAIWAVASENGLLRFNAQAQRWDRVHVGVDDQSIYGIGSSGTSIIATGGRFVARSDDSGATWDTIVPRDENLGDVVAAITTDASGQLWVGSEAGVSVLTGGQWRRLWPTGELPMNSIGSLEQAPDGRLWAIEQYGGAAGIVDPASMAVEPSLLPDTSIQAVAFSEDTVWLGTTDGIVRQRRGAQLRITSADGLPSDNIRSMLVVDTALWVGTDAGLALYDLGAEQVSGTVDEFEGATIQSLFHAPDGAVWAGSIKEDETDLLALGRYDGSAWQIWQSGEAPLPESSSGVASINADSEGRVWVSVWNGGIATWDGDTWRIWAEGDGAPSRNMQVIVAQDDALWIGGQSSGLSRWDKDGWRLITIDGLSSDVLDLHFTADGALWLATGDGLLRIAKEGVDALQ